jgi:hypothetical protein
MDKSIPLLIAPICAVTERRSPAICARLPHQSCQWGRCCIALADWVRALGVGTGRPDEETTPLEMQTKHHGRPLAEDAVKTASRLLLNACRKISWNICCAMATSAIWKIT